MLHSSALDPTLKWRAFTTLFMFYVGNFQHRLFDSHISTLRRRGVPLCGYATIKAAHGGACYNHHYGDLSNYSNQLPLVERQTHLADLLSADYSIYSE